MGLLTKPTASVHFGLVAFLAIGVLACGEGQPVDLGPTDSGSEVMDAPPVDPRHPLPVYFIPAVLSTPVEGRWRPLEPG